MVILASQSPRRKQLMKEITNDFSVVVSDVDETTSPHLTPLEAVKEIAFRKASAVYSKYPKDIIISADTIVTIDNKIIGKPIDKEDAKNILKLLSGRKHHVITAYVIAANGEFKENTVDTEVEFEMLDSDLIDRYVASGSPMDKAGAYGIQDDEQFHLVKRIKGSYTNVVGFPVDEIKADFERMRKENQK